VIKLRELVTFLLTAPKNLIILAVIILIPDPSSGQDFQITGKLVARTGPAESYPIAAELPISARVTKVAEDPNGWIAVRTGDGHIVWLPAGAFQSNAALLSTIPPLNPQTKSSGSGTGNERDNSVSNAVLLTSTNPGMVSGAGGYTAGAPVEPGGWRPATGGVSNPASKYDRTVREGTRSQNQSHAISSQLTRSESPDLVLDEVDQELSTLLTKDPTLWQVNPLQDKLASLAGRPLTAQQIERLDGLARKLATAKQIADLARRVQSPNQPVSNITVPASTPGVLSNSVAASPAVATTLGWTTTGMNSGTLSTLVPPPGTRIPLETRVTGTTEQAASFGIPQSQTHPSVLSSAKGPSEPPEVSPASFEVNPTGQQPVGAAGTLPPNRSPQEMSTENGSNQPATNSLREEIARELNDLRRERFDAVGRLVKAQVRRPTDPPYVVLNESGNVVCYVKPSPGTLLRSYVGHWVGLAGRKSRLPDGRGPLIIAESLRLLDPPQETAQR